MTTALQAFAFDSHDDERGSSSSGLPPIAPTQHWHGELHGTGCGMTSTTDIEAVLADPEALGELIKVALSGKRRTFLDEVLVDFLRGYFKARAKLEGQS